MSIPAPSIQELNKSIALKLGYKLLSGFSSKEMATMWYGINPDGSRWHDEYNCCEWRLCCESSKFSRGDWVEYTEEEAWKMAPIPNWAGDLKEAMTLCAEIGFVRSKEWWLVIRPDAITPWYSAWFVDYDWQQEGRWEVMHQYIVRKGNIELEGEGETLEFALCQLALLACCGFLLFPIIFIIILLIDLFRHPEDYVIGG